MNPRSLLFPVGIFLLVVWAPLSGAASDTLPEPASTFGAAVTLEQATPLGQVLAAPDEFTAQPVLLRGRLTDVCQKKGCWTVLMDGESVVRVSFQDYGFFLPKDALGAEALVQGVASVRELSEREARHYASESRDGDPDAIQGPQREIGFVASGVRLLAE